MSRQRANCDVLPPRQNLLPPGIPRGMAQAGPAAQVGVPLGRGGPAVHIPQPFQAQQPPKVLKSEKIVAPPPVFEKRSSEVAVKREWDESAKRWIESRIIVVFETTHFAAGALRYAYRMSDVTDPKNPVALVAKISKNPKEPYEGYTADVQMQMVAKSWAEKFNARGVPKMVDFLSAFLVQLIERPGKPVCAVEKFVEGEYVRYNNNWDWSDDLRNTPQAFSHFTYEESEHNILVCDIQGVGDIYTDPQIHTRDGKFGKGNKGLQGFARFFSGHSCNAICHFLNLAMVGGSKRPKPAFKGTPPPSWFLAGWNTTPKASESKKLVSAAHKAAHGCESSDEDCSEKESTSCSDTDSFETAEMEIASKLAQKDKRQAADDRRGSLFEQVNQWEESQLKHSSDDDSDDSDDSFPPKRNVGRGGKHVISIIAEEDELSRKGTTPRCQSTPTTPKNATAIPTTPKNGAAAVNPASSESSQREELSPAKADQSPTPFSTPKGLVGVGMRLEGNQATGYSVAALTAGCPAAKSGQIRAGDILLSVDGTLLKALALDDVKRLIVGEEGSKVALAFARKTPARVTEFSVVISRGNAVVPGIVSC